MDENQILKRFMIYSSLPEDKAVEYLYIIRDSIRYIEKMWNKNSEGGQSQLNNAAAALSYWQYCILLCQDGSGFKAGEITVTQGNAKQAEELWHQTKELASPWLNSRKFAFRRIS